MTRTHAISGTALIVSAGTDADDLLGEPALAATGLALERASDPDAAIERLERGYAVDVVMLAPGLAEPVRVAQRLHSLDRLSALLVLAEPGREEELRHALSVAPFLAGDVSLLSAADAAAVAEALADAAARTRARRELATTRKARRETPPPLSARYLGTLLDRAPIGLVTLDGDGAVIGWNKRTGEMLGVAEVEALGAPFADLFADADRPRLAALIAKLGTEGIEDDGQIFEREGRAFELTGARFAIRSGEGGALLILQDVTKRRAAEREVELQRALMAAQADSSEVGIAVIRLDGTLERVNRRWSEIWGADQTGLERLPWTEAGDFRDEVVLGDGRVIERYATDVRSEPGEVVGRIWFHTDITAHRREEESLRFLADATNLLSSSLEYETTLQRVADLAVPRVARWCSVEIAEKHGHRAVAIAHPDPERLAMIREARSRYSDVQTGVVGRVIASGAPLIFREMSDDDVVAMARDGRHLEILRALELRSVMVVPIKVRDRVFGAISFIRGPADPPYDDDDLKLAEELARRAAIAIDNSRVHRELRDTARTLQESLLPPHLPAIRGLELAARFRPAGAGMQVGGDFYDIFETKPGQWGIVVGDVCGKGAEAAALTALTRYTVRAAAMYEDDAGGVLRVLNEALLRQRNDFRFTTLAFCLLDLEGSPRRLRAASAGHPRPLVLAASGGPRPVGAMGPLLGVVAHAEFQDEELDLGEGDALIMYTDGLTDALAPQQILGENDLLRALGECGGLSAAEITGRLEDVALAGDGSRIPRDDIALVVAKLA